jgi:hypothetical protein
MKMCDGIALGSPLRGPAAILSRWEISKCWYHCCDLISVVVRGADVTRDEVCVFGGKRSGLLEPLVRCTVWLNIRYYLGVIILRPGTVEQCY